MASFEQWIQPPKRRYRRIYGSPPHYITYQNIDTDKGNWTGGQLGVGIKAGTNRSISAPVLSSWRGHPVSAAEMQALTAEEALEIYKVKFWDKILGDQIISQIIAEFAADMKSSTGNNKALQRALNDIGYSVAVDGQIGPQTLAAINQAEADGKTTLLYNAHRSRMIEHYQGDPYHSTALINQLNKDYPERSSNDTVFNNPSSTSSGGLVLAGIAALGLWLYNR